MRPIILIIFFLSSINLSSQDTFDEKTQKGAVFMIIEFFVKTMKDYGFESQIKKIKVNTVIEFYDLEKELGNFAKGTIAIANGTMDNSKTHIIIDKEMWMSLSDLEQVTTIFHEICHDVFNVKHIDWDDKYNLMHPYIQPKSIDDLVLMTSRFFRDYSEGKLEFFKPGELYIHNNSLRSKTETFNRKIVRIN